MTTYPKDARDFLEVIFTGRRPISQRFILERGARHGFSYDQLKRAKKALGVVAFKKRGEGLDAPWMWALPQHAPPEAEREPA
jgi:hypothetical protein